MIGTPIILMHVKTLCKREMKNFFEIVADDILCGCDRDRKQKKQPRRAVTELRSGMTGLGLNLGDCCFLIQDDRDDNRVSVGLLEQIWFQRRTDAVL